jgi:hypothetical protein
MCAATMYFMMRRTPYTSSCAATIYIITCIITRRQSTMGNVVGGKMAGLYVCARGVVQVCGWGSVFAANLLREQVALRVR